MKRSTSFVSLALSIILLFALAVPAAAESGTKSIGITYRAVSIVVDGVLIAPVDASGAPVEPFIYGGTTYLPVRAVAGALGLSVVWDDATSTISLTSGSAADTGSGTPTATYSTKNIEITYRDIIISINGGTITPKDAAGTAVEPFIYDSTTYLPVRAVAAALGVEVGWDGNTGIVYLGEQPKTTLWLNKTETNYDSDGAVSYVDTYTYDIYGRCTAISTHYPAYPKSDSTVTRTYDAAGNLVMDDYGDGYSRYSYDEGGSLISDKYYYGSSMTEWQYAYDASGRLEKTTILSGGAYVGSSVRTYDERGDLVKNATEYTDRSVLESFAYTYGSSGLRESMSYAYSSGVYGYGRFYMYAYDASGRLSVEHQYWVENGEKEYYDTVRYSYDANGCLAARDYDSGRTVYTYISMEQ